MIYKIIAKVLALRLKPVLSEIITEEKFGFLNNMKIHDAVSIAQEIIHSIKKERKKSLCLKTRFIKSLRQSGMDFCKTLVDKNRG